MIVTVELDVNDVLVGSVVHQVFYWVPQVVSLLVKVTSRFVSRLESMDPVDWIV